MSKWTAKFWEDTAERVGTTLIYGVITFITLGGTGLPWDQIWPVIGLPTVLSLLKALLVNLNAGDGGATASLVNVKSRTADVPPPGGTV